MPVADTLLKYERPLLHHGWETADSSMPDMGYASCVTSGSDFLAFEFLLVNAVSRTDIPIVNLSLPDCRERFTRRTAACWKDPAPEFFVFHFADLLEKGFRRSRSASSGELPPHPFYICRSSLAGTQHRIGQRIRTFGKRVLILRSEPVSAN